MSDNLVEKEIKGPFKLSVNFKPAYFFLGLWMTQILVQRIYSTHFQVISTNNCF